MIDWTHLLGVALALGAALSMAGTNLFIRKGTDEGQAYDALFVVILVEVLVLPVPILALYYPDYGLTPVAWASFVVAGLTGTVLGQIFHFLSIGAIGASRTAPIVAAWGLVSTVLGVVVLDETVSPVHGIGVVLVVGGVAAIAWETTHENPENLSRRELLLGLLVPLGAVVAYGVEPVFAKIGFAEGTPAPVGLVIKTVAALVGVTAYLWWRRGLPDPALFRSESGRWYVLAGIATTLFLIGYYGALELAPVSIVAPIIVTNTLFVVVLAWLFMPSQLERVTRHLFVAATVVVAGVVIITVFS